MRPLHHYLERTMLYTLTSFVLFMNSVKGYWLIGIVGSGIVLWDLIDDGIKEIKSKKENPK